ncbi:MAG: adenine-specific methyltransferase EcoRI family protein, partial [Bacteroidales bacterium]|nr:adenine-specific methyltransferase EcoRI family protein [Bacteroidales bacterium]
LKGKIFELTHDTNQNGRIDIEDLEWHYLEGDGDFRSKEVCLLRDQADVIVTNPPFSLFRDFVAWIMEAGKQFLILGHMNAIHYKEVFPLIQSNQVWSGIGFNLSMIYKAPYENYLEANQKYVRSKGYNPDDNYIKVPAVCWFTNIEHGRRHEPLKLMSAQDNIRYGKNKEIKQRGYLKYENYDAIDVPSVESIPDDYLGAMGVPDSFIAKYCPEQFEIIGLGSGYLGQSIGVGGIPKEHKNLMKGHSAAGDLYMLVDGVPKVPYSRILIRKKQ